MILKNLSFFHIGLIIYCTSIRISFGSPLSSNATARSHSVSGYENLIYKRDILRLSKAAEIKAFMDEDVAPCTDFYRFACGKWNIINKAATVPTTGFFEALSKGMTRKIFIALNDTSDSAATDDVDKMVKRFYKSCMKLHGQPVSEHRAELLEIIDEFGSMPALSGSDWDETNFDWMEIIAKIQNKYALQIILSIEIMADFKNNSINRMYVGQASLTLESKSMYLDSENQFYRDLYVKRIAEELQKNFAMSADVAQSTAREIVEFEIDLAKGMMDDNISKSLDESTIYTTIEEIQKKYAPMLDMRKYINYSFGKAVNEPFYEYAEDFQRNLKSVIENTPKRKIANYIFYQLASEFFPKVSREQQSTCKGVVNKYFAKVLDNMIYRRYKTADTERDINNIWVEIKNAFRDKLLSDNLNWISLSTRQKALIKLEAMKLEINSYVDTNFTKEFGDLVIDDAHYIANMKSILNHQAKKIVAKLGGKVEPLEASEELSYTPANIILENKIKIPVSLLQPYYLWDDFYPTALKFGTLGFLIGHELIHGFDDSGREYDEVGNQRDWWDETSKNAFISRTQCFMNQYHRYKFGGRFLRESESQSENIADNGGLKIAYEAYLKFIQRNRVDLNDESLPNLKYTNKQLFFISFAQVWCSDTHPSLMALQTATDEHTPGEFRVKGVVSNLPEFAKEFNCPMGTEMNPGERCEIY